MSGPFGSSPWGYNPGGDFYSYTIDQSLRFNDNDSAKLTRTPASAGSLTTWTWSSWIKRGNLAAGMPARGTIFSGNSGPTAFGFMNPNTNGAADNFGAYISTGLDDRFRTNRLFRDASAWYHLVVVWDSTNGTADDRFRLYVNGVRETSWSRFDTVTQNRTAGINAAALHGIGVQANAGSQFFDGYLAEMNFIDGTALTADSFGETKDGVWIPKEYTGSYGTNGFYLSFKNSDLNTTGSSRSDPYGSSTDQPNNTFADGSGSGNHWTISGLAATDIVSDSPTNNFCTINRADSNVTISEGNLKALGVSGTYFNLKGSFNFDVALSDGWYFEFISINGSVNEGSVGIAPSSYLFSNVTSPAVINDTKTYNPDGSINFSTSFAGATWANGDIIGVAVKNGKIYYSKNGVFQASADPVNETNPATTGLTGFYAPFMYSASSGTGGVFNFGQDSSFAGLKTSGSAEASDANGIGDFYYAPPSGFLALASSNLPEPEIIDGPEHFNTVLWTGNGASSRAISGVGFSPDFVWAKQRGQDIGHVLYDSVRGVGNDKELSSNSTQAEGGGNSDQYGYLSSFDSDGFTGVDGTGSPNYYFNENSQTFVAWNWLAGTAFSNSAGSNGATIASSGSVNTSAGFSIVSYTGSGSNGTVLHGLSSAPEIIFFKKREVSTNWMVYNKTIGNNRFLYLDLTNSQTGTDSTYFNNLDPTASVINLGTYHRNNSSTEPYIAYCFHSVEGYSKVGSYTGNGSADGTFVFTGFRPAFVMIKRTDSTSWWGISDAARSTYNEIANTLAADEAYSEATLTSDLNLDFLSNGFKIRDTDAYYNALGGTYIYLAFAQSPFKFANAR